MALRPAEWLRLGMCHCTTAVAPLLLTPDGLTDPLLQRLGEDSSRTVWIAWWWLANGVNVCELDAGTMLIQLGSPCRKCVKMEVRTMGGKQKGGHEDWDKYSPAAFCPLLFWFSNQNLKESFQWGKRLKKGTKYQVTPNVNAVFAHWPCSIATAGPK